MNNRPPRSFVLSRSIPRAALALGLGALIGCGKPAVPSSRGDQNSAPDAPASAPSSPPRHVPSPSDLAGFLRSLFPPGGVQLVDLKHDPPAPLPGTLAGNDAWLFNVRLSLAPTEDLFAPAPAQDTQALQTLLEELQGLVDWSQTYAHSPYTDLGPVFTVQAPTPAAPQLLVLAHAKGQPFAPLYGQVAAAWQVDHWRFSVLDLPPPANDQSRPLGRFQGATLVQGSPAATRYQAEAQATVQAAKEHQAAIERRYQEALAQATRPGATYRGELRLRSEGSKKPPAPAEVRFVDVPADAAHVHQARFSVRLAQAPGDEFLFQVDLAAHLPLVLPAQAAQFHDAAVTSLGDATINGWRATGKDATGANLAGLLLSALQSGTTPRHLPLFLHNRRFEGTVANGMLGNLVLSAGQ